VSYGDEFLDDLNTIVTIEPYLGQTSGGARSYGPLHYYRSYLDATGTLYRNAQGQQLVDSVAVYAHPLEVNADGSARPGGVRLAKLHVNSRIGIPDLTAPGGIAYPVILKVDGISDETPGVQIWVVHT